MALTFVTRTVAALQKLGIPYMVVGSFSANVWGEPRSTHDADFVIQLTNQSLTPLMNELGAEFRLDPQMGFETITSTMRYRITHAAAEFMIELFLLSDDAHDQERFRRRVSGNIGDGQATFVPTAEDVVITKLRWSKHGKRQKDIQDATVVMAVQAGRLDLEYMRKWCDLHQTRDLLDRLLTETSEFEQK